MNKELRKYVIKSITCRGANRAYDFLQANGETVSKYIFKDCKNIDRYFQYDNSKDKWILSITIPSTFDTTMVNIDEIIELLPIEFESGDIVECISNINLPGSGSGFIQGEHYKVNSYSYNYIKVAKDSNNAPNGWDSYRFKKVRNSSSKTTTNSTTPINWLSISYTPSANDPFGVKGPEVTWKKPKGLQPAINKVDLDDEVLIDGMPIPQVVASVLANGDVEVEGSNNTYKASDVYKVFKVSPTNDLVAGCYVVNTKGDIGIFKDVGVGGILNISTPTQDVIIDIKDIDYVISTEPPKLKVYKYTCGTHIIDGKKYTKEDFEVLSKDYTINLISVDMTAEANDISEHYGITIDSLIPKEDVIMKHLKIALDHPLNVINKEWCLLLGKSGSGKTELAIQYATESNKDYVVLTCTAQTTVDDFIGWKSVTTGEYIPSILREAVEHGKVLICDEIDACNSNSLLVLNSLKGEYFQFPDKKIKIHEDFRLIGTANTLEYNEQYNARSPMDKATIARFDVIHYDLEPHELALRFGFNYVKDLDVHTLTPRDIQRLVTKQKIKETLNEF